MAGHGGHSLDDVGDGLGLDGVAEEEKAGEEGVEKAMEPIALFEGREVKGEQEETSRGGGLS